MGFDAGATHLRLTSTILGIGLVGGVDGRVKCLS